MNSKGFVTAGSREYFAEREMRLQGHIDDARSKIDEIETKVRAELSDIGVERERLRLHLEGFIDARNKLAEHRNKTIDLVTQLQGVITICDTQLPVLDSMLDELETEALATDARMEDAEKSRHRQLHKHERKRVRFELRKTRLGLRAKLFGIDTTEASK